VAITSIGGKCNNGTLEPTADLNSLLWSKGSHGFIYTVLAGVGKYTKGQIQTRIEFRKSC
jgi:hypothetical protein